MAVVTTIDFMKNIADIIINLDKAYSSIVLEVFLRIIVIVVALPRNAHLVMS